MRDRRARGRRATSRRWGAHSPARTGRSRGRRRACRGGRRSFVRVAAARRRGERRARAARTRPWPWPGRSRSTGSGRHPRRRAGAPGAPPAPPHGAKVGHPDAGGSAGRCRRSRHDGSRRAGSLGECTLLEMLETRRRAELTVTAVLLGLGLLVAAVATHDAWRRVGQPSPGHAIMENLLVVVGGGERGILQPFDKVVALNGRVPTWALTPNALAHLALRFPEKRGIARRHPWLVPLLWAEGAVAAAALPLTFFWRSLALPMFVAACWGVALIALIVSLARTARRGSTPLARQRAKFLAVGFAVSFLFPVLGTAAEILFWIGVPYLNQSWRLNLVFPLVVAYAIVRYNLFDIGAVLRLGAIYSAATVLVTLLYAGSLTGINVAFSMLDMSVSPLVPAGLVSLLVVALLNPVYQRTQRLVDRAFFRQRYDAQQTVERLASAMTTVLELPRIGGLIRHTVDELFHPVTTTLVVSDDGTRGYRALDERGAPGGAATGGDPRIGAGQSLEVRAPRGAEPHRRGTRSAGPGQARRGRLGALRGHRRLHAPQRAARQRAGQPAGRALLRRFPRRDRAVRRRRP